MVACSTTSTTNSECRNWGAGIGGSAYGSCGTITISGGTVSATTYSSTSYGGAPGAGIGNGYYGSSSGTITISGGMVTATSAAKGYPSSGIGSGRGDVSKSCDITISGGTVTATSSGQMSDGTSDYMGISCGNTGKITITGGNVKMISKYSYHATPVNSSNISVYCTEFTLKNVTTTQLIRAGIITPSYSYGLKDVETMKDGSVQKLFFWLPVASDKTVAVMATDKTSANKSNIYAKTGVTTVSGTNAAVTSTHELTPNSSFITQKGVFTVYKDDEV